MVTDRITDRIIQEGRENAERRRAQAEEEGCQGHPCEDDADRYPHAAIGDVVYCDGSCRRNSR